MVKYDSSKYLSRMDDIRAILKRNPCVSPVDLVGLTSVATGVPIIVTCQFIIELVGETPELLDKLAKLKTWYRYQ